MKGLITKTAASFCIGAGLALLGGCTCYRSLVDPCWLERYAGASRTSIREMAAAQTDKGHILDQTVWNWMFETDIKGGPTDRLSPAGVEHLKVISRRLPVPDGQVYLQTAQDIPYTPAVPPERLVDSRNELNNRRTQAIQRFLATQTMTQASVYHVAIHDFAPPGIEANPIVGTQVPPAPIPGAYPQLQQNFKGKQPNITSLGGSSTQ